MRTAKQEALDLLEHLPDDVSMETLLAALQSKAGVLRGLEDATRGYGIGHDEAKRRLARWIETRGDSRFSSPL